MTALPPPLPGSDADGPGTTPTTRSTAPAVTGTAPTSGAAAPRGTVTAPGGGGDVLVGPAGWYPHPDGGERWWDGTAWTTLARTRTRRRRVRTVDLAAEADARRARRARRRTILVLVGIFVVWLLGNATWSLLTERYPALEATTPAERAAAVLGAPRGLGTGDACPTTDKQLVDPASPGVARWRELRGCDLTPALDRAGWTWVTRPTDDAPTGVVDYTFADDPADDHPDADLGGTTVRLTLTLEKVFRGWKVASVDGLPARAQG